MTGPNALHHNVYVVELRREVFAEPQFAEANPYHDSRKPCVYVGCTGLTPEERFENHLNGIKSAKFVRIYGVRLRPRLYAHFNPMTYVDAAAMEKLLAVRLRKKGYAVWQK